MRIAAIAVEELLLRIGPVKVEAAHAERVLAGYALCLKLTVNAKAFVAAHTEEVLGTGEARGYVPIGTVRRALIMNPRVAAGELYKVSVRAIALRAAKLLAAASKAFVALIALPVAELWLPDAAA